jgi:restriction system protein
MAVPDFQSMMLPFLRSTADGEEHQMVDVRQMLAKEFQLTEAEIKELLPSGKQSRFSNRVAWAKVYLAQAGLLDTPKRGAFRISNRGRELLSNPPEAIDIKFLERYPEFLEFRYQRKKHDEGSESEDEKGIKKEIETPEEALEQAALRLNEELSTQLLKQVKSNSPDFFEKLVVQLLVKMGYGGSIQDAGKAIGRAGDEGIDGIIKEDKLGLDVIYIQAKRWEAVIGRPEVQKFVGALHGQRAKKGVFITTSGFSEQAVHYVSQIDPKVVLIDGKQLVSYMIDHNVGVSISNVIEVKNIDSDYFLED